MPVKERRRRKLTALSEPLLEPDDRILHMAVAQVGKAPVKKNVAALAFSLAVAVVVGALGGRTSMAVFYTRGHAYFVVTDRRLLIFAGRRDWPGPGRLLANVPRYAVTLTKVTDGLTHKIRLRIDGSDEEIRLSFPPLNPGARREARQLVALLGPIQPAAGQRGGEARHVPQGSGEGERAARGKGLRVMLAGLRWWQIVLVVLPLTLIGIGGALGGLVGGAAAGANTALARRKRYGAGVMALTMGTVSVSAYGAYFLIALLIVGAGHSATTTFVQPSAAPTPYRSPQPVQQWKPVPAGVIANQPSVINATGAALTWPAYVNTTGDAPYDVATYEVYRSTLNYDLSRSPGTLIGSVHSGQTSFVDTSAPARTGPHDGIYHYLIGVRTKGGRFIQGTPVLVQLPMPGHTELAIPATAAATIASGQPNAIADTVISQRSTKLLEIGPDEDLGLGNTRLVFDFGPLTALPGGAALIEAHLSVWPTSGGNYADQYTVYALSRSFTGSQVTWNSASTGIPWAHPGGDYTTPTGRVLHAIDPSIARRDYDATAAVRGWITNPSSEHGLLLKADTESVRTAPLLNAFYVPIGGSYPPYPAWECPQLYITYTGAAPAVAATASATP
jgi:hypothetical protein